MSLPRFRLVQGKAIGERSTPTSSSSNGVSTTEPTSQSIQNVLPQHPVKTEITSVENYQENLPMKPEPQMIIKHELPNMGFDDPTSPPMMMGGTSQHQHPIQRPGQQQQLQFQNPMAIGEDDKNVTKCVRFLKTLINLSNNEDPEQPDKAVRVQDLIRGVIYGETTAEEFTRNLQQVLKSQAQPHLLPFLQNTLPALRAAVRNGEAQVDGVSPPIGYVFSNGRAPPPQQSHEMRPPMPPPAGHPSQQIISRLNAEPQMAPRPLIQRTGPAQVPMHPQRPPMGGQMPMGPPTMHPMGPPMMQHPHGPQQQMPPPQMQPSMNPVQHQGERMEVDEPPRMRQYAETSLKSSILRPDEILNRITKRMMASCTVEEEALVAISDAVESQLRDMVTLMAGIAEHRVESMRVPENYVSCDDVKKQLRFLEDLDRQEEEMRESREKELLIRQSKNKNIGKETMDKAKEVQRQVAEAQRNRDANAAAIAALSSNRTVKNKWEGSAPASSAPRPRTVRVTTRDLHLLANTDNRFRGSFIREKLAYGGPATDNLL
ncbi:unnamed protein product [Caenorhabditis sp. 36 PRJEB53466]|nr:unnamed protein product [Caenorhabditis sp. 36 PRJEB53466]